MDEDGETSINISSTTDQITLQPGEFKIYGNQSSTSLTTTDVSIDNVKMYPNPSENIISFDNSLEIVEIFDITGKKLYTFIDVLKNQNLDISNLSSGYYIVKILHQNRFENRKLIVK